jgi:hypothetical protein
MTLLAVKSVPIRDTFRREHGKSRGLLLIPEPRPLTEAHVGAHRVLKRPESPEVP